MERTELVNKLTPIFRTVFSNDALVISDELTANDVENWDSLSHMLLITDIESVFSIKFKLKELNRMRNVGDMIDIISLKL